MTSGCIGTKSETEPTIPDQLSSEITVNIYRDFTTFAEHVDGALSIRSNGLHLFLTKHHRTFSLHEITYAIRINCDVCIDEHAHQLGGSISGGQ